MKVIDPEDYDVKGISCAVSSLANCLQADNARDSMFSDCFAHGLRELIRLTTDVMEEAWKGNGVPKSVIYFFKHL